MRYSSRRPERFAIRATVAGRSFVAVRLLPRKRTRSDDGGWASARVLVSQYLAYLDGRIEEVALDLYAQADDGSAWYLGEDVFNYEDGAIADTEGSGLPASTGRRR